MTKLYEKAARIAQSIGSLHNNTDRTRAVARSQARIVENAFVALFRDDNPAFDEVRFRAACVPGAKATARPKRVCAKHMAPAGDCGCSR